MASKELGQIYSSLVETTIAYKADVVVAGGGTAGCVAAIAAARQGADTLLVERQGFLGGMMTCGNAGLAKYIMHDVDPRSYKMIVDELKHNPQSVQVVGGLPLAITNRLIANKWAIGTNGQAGSFVYTSPEEFKLCLLDMMEEAGVRLLLHSFLVDVILTSKQLEGVIVENKSGRQAILAQICIDATGDADLAAKAGVPFHIGVGPDDIVAQEGMKLGSMHQMGVMFRMGNIDMRRCFDFLMEHPEHYQMQRFNLMELEDAFNSYLNGDTMSIWIKIPDHTFIIDNSPLPGIFTFGVPMFDGSGVSVEDLSKGEIFLAKEVYRRAEAMKSFLPGFESAYLLDSPEIGVRETRHIEGEYKLTAEDIYTMREFPDTIGKGCCPIDIYPIPRKLRDQTLPPRWSFNIPYRCLVPKNIEGLLVAGRALSATREATGSVRPTVQCMITGEAAGTAATMCVKEGVSPRNLDGRRVRAALAQNGAVV